MSVASINPSIEKKTQDDHHSLTPLVQADCSSSFVQHLTSAKQQVKALEQIRIERALAANSAEFRHVFLLLSLLIHCNHPHLPGYVEGAPIGIANFQLSDYQKCYLRIVLGSKAIATVMPEFPVFDGLYVMGSIGSISQTSLSDLDIWLCYQDNLSISDYAKIEIKLKHIKLWAEKFQVELSFYLMNPTRFKNKDYSSGVTTEHSGSAQHFFLLDEFYRSAICLSGKPLLWLHIASDTQHSYSEVIQNAVAKQELCLADWLDFGCFSELSASEYFGASLWQLYKGIDAPYKSAIKILLLEIYAQTYPATTLISKLFKQKLLESPTIEYHFDPYLTMLEMVTDYLTQRNEPQRLAQLRHCFYIKASEGLQYDNWRRRKLAELVQEWGWNQDEKNILDHRQFWKIKQAMSHQVMLVEQLLQSYRHLMHFARKYRINPSIMPQDIDILMRKLYSVFEQLPGKITLINPRITSNLAESEVTFIEVTEGSAMKSGWYLINQAPKSRYDSVRRYVQYHTTLNKLVAWAYFNGLITANTQLHIASKSMSLDRLRHFITDLRLSFPVKAPAMCNEDLYHPNEIRNLILAINLTNDPTQQLPTIKRTVIAQSDLFNFGNAQQSLVGSVDIIYRNLWNEIKTKHFDGCSAILEALKFISNKIYRSSAPPQSVNVFCYSRQLQTELRDFIADLVNKCISIQLGTIFQKQQLNTLKVAGKTWQFIFEKERIDLQEVSQPTAEDVSLHKPLNNYIEQAKSAFLFPIEISDFASEGFLQFFFEDNADTTFNVYILDDKNNVEIYFKCRGTKEEKVKDINQLLSEYKCRPETGNMVESFNFPQFYQLIKPQDTVKIVPFQSQQHRDYVEKYQG